MLQQRQFLTANDLDITEQAYDGLIKTLALLEGGTVTHYRYNNDEEVFNSDEGLIPKGHHLNMNDWWMGTENQECGTVGCIGGTMEFVFDVDLTHTDRANMHNLFFPHAEAFVILDVDVSPRFLEVSYNDITVEQTITAIRNFLYTGAPNWADVLA